MLEPLLFAFSDYLHPSQFRDVARHPDFPNASTRDRKLLLPALLAALLSGGERQLSWPVDDNYLGRFVT